MAVSFSAMFLVPAWPLDFSRGDAQGRRMAEDETDEVPKLPPDARLESLDERLDRLQQAEAKRTEGRRPIPTMRIGQQRLRPSDRRARSAAAVIGWGLDSAGFGHRQPWFMLVMLFFGFGVGIRNVIRISRHPGPGSGQRER